MSKRSASKKLSAWVCSKYSLLLLDRQGQEVTFVSFTRKTPGSNPGRGTDYPGRIFDALTLLLYVNAPISAKNRACAFPFTSFPLRYSLSSYRSTLCVQSELLTP
jgi:hypothetical protein